MVRPNPADMQNCDEKCRCSLGPYKGFAYSCENPCNAGADFDKRFCDCREVEGIWLFTGAQAGCRAPGSQTFPIVPDGRQGCDRPTREVTAAFNQSELNNGAVLEYTRPVPPFFSCTGTVGRTSGPEAPVDMQCFPAECVGQSFACGIFIRYDQDPEPFPGSRAILTNAGCKCADFPVEDTSSAPCGGCYLRGSWIFVPE